MKSKKKLIIPGILILVAAILLLFPQVGQFLKDQFFMKATVEKLENSVILSDQELDIELKGINTPDTNLKTLKNKTLLLNFWGTWCQPCREEWPSLQALYDGKKDDMNFALIAMQDKEEAVRKFVKENNYTAPVYIAQSPMDAKLLPQVFPTTYLITNTGQIAKKEEATFDWNSPEIHTFINNISKK